MLKQLWIFLINTFDVNTRGSNRKMLTLVTDTHAKLNNEIADPEILLIFNRLDPVYDSYRQISMNYDLVAGNYEGKTLAFENLIDTLPLEIRKWESAIRAVYIEDTPEEHAIFPNKRNPFLKGNYEERLSAIGTLAESLSTDSDLAAAHAVVESFYNLALSTRLAQQQKEGALGQISDVRENQRKLVAVELYGVLGGLMVLFRADPSQIERFFDLTLLRSKGDSDNNGDGDGDGEEPNNQSLEISGTAYNASNAMPLPGVLVTATLATANATGTTIETTTDENGQFSLTVEDLTEISEGNLQASITGFNSKTTNITATPGEDLPNIDFVLEPGV